MGTLTDAKVITKAFDVDVKTKQAEGERTILAVVSSPNMDRDYERVDVTSLRIPLKGGGYVAAKDLTGTENIDLPFLLNHSFDVEDVIGSARKAFINESGELVVEFGVSSRAKAQDLMLLIDEGHLDNAFSITMSDFQYADSTIYNAEVIEISLVFRGSNKDARVLAVKSLLKGDDFMADAKEESKPEVIAEAEEVEVTETPVVEVLETNEVEEVAKEEADNKPTEAEVEEEKTEEAAEEVASDEKSEEAEAEVETVEVKQEEKESKMSEAKEIAKTQVVAKKAEVAQKAKEAPAVSEKQVRELFVKQFLAVRTNNSAELAELNKKLMDMRGISSKAPISYANGEALYQDEVVSNDILEQYQQYGNVGNLVNKLDILGAEKWKRPVETNGNGFTPVGLEGTKDEDKPVWTSLTVTPHEHALIVAWYDAIARRTPIAVYNQIINYIARMYAKLEDTIVLTFEGGTFDGETFEQTGLVPELTDENRVVEIADYSSEAIVTGLGEAYGLVESDGQPTIVANRKTWGKMAVAVDGDGNTVFNVVGNQVQAGALGTFNVVVSQAMPDDQAVIGVFSDYDLVTRGALEQLFSREATVGSFNLFTQDGSAVRSNIDISGGAARLESFVLLDFATS